MPEYILKVCGEDSGSRLDIFVLVFAKKNNLGLSRTAVQKLILCGKIRSKDTVDLKPHYKIKLGEEFRLFLEENKPREVKPEEIPLEVIFEDNDLAIIDKPVGLVVHPAPGNYEHTLVNALLARFDHLSDIDPERPGIVHRLDKDTSGLLVIAKNNPTHLALSEQFAKHTIKRKYIAVVKGKVEFDEHVIEAPIGRHPYKRKNMSVNFSTNTRYAKTHLRTLERRDNFSLVELEPFTGRTHQLRVHLAFIGNPILGDNKYGKDNKFERLCLHAKYLGFMHPASGKFIEFFSSIPKEFLGLLQNKA